MITSRKFKLNKSGDWQRHTRYETWHGANAEIGVAIQKMVLSGGWTHSLRVQSSRASERNSVIVASGQLSIATPTILQWWIPYMTAHSATVMLLPQENSN